MTAEPTTGLESQIDAFRARCGGPSLLLCAHAAILDSIRPDTVALLRRNFLVGDVRLRADLDADVLFGGLADDLGGGYFRMRPVIRRQLVTALDAYGVRMNEHEYLSSRVARFVRFYVRWARYRHELAGDPRFETYLDEIEWVALGYDEPDKAAHAIQAIVDPVGETRGRRISLGRPAALLALPLNAFSSTLAGFEALEVARALLRDGHREEAQRLMASYAELPASLDASARTFGEILTSAAVSMAGASRAPAATSVAPGQQTAPTTSIAPPAAMMSAALENNAWHDAVERGDVDGLQRLARERMAGVDACGVKGLTPLLLAAELDRREAAAVLVAAGADVNAPESGGGRPLNFAVLYGLDWLFELLLAAGADIQLGGAASGSTPLMLAVYYWRQPMLQQLLERGADIATRNTTGFSALDYAASAGNNQAFSTLRARGAPLVLERPEWPLLSFAAFGGNPAILTHVMAAGADTNSGDRIGWRPLHLATQEKHVRAVELLLEMGANPNAAVQGWTALMTAASAGDDVICRRLLTYGADPNITKRDGYTALLLACHHGHVGAIEALLSSPDLDRRHTANDHRSPLTIAVEKSSLDMAKALLADPRIERNHRIAKDALPPIWEALEKNQPAIFIVLCADPAVDRMVRHGGTTLLHKTVSNVALLRPLLDGGVDVDALDTEGRTALYMAIPASHKADQPPAGRLDVLRLLLAYGASPDAPAGSADAAPVLRAVQAGDVEALQILLAHRARLDITDSCERGLLHVATAATVDLLLAQGLDANAVDASGETPLASAVRRGDLALVQKLAASARLDLADADGWTALHVAAQSGSADVAKALLDAGALPEPIADTPPLSPLQAAAEVGAASVCALLVAYGADVNRQDGRSPTPLVLALRMGQFQAAVDLLHLGASRDVLDPISGSPALEVFATRRRFETRAGSLNAEVVEPLEQLLLGRATQHAPPLRPPIAVRESPRPEPPARAAPAEKAPRPVSSTRAAEPVSSQFAGGIFLAHLDPASPEEPVAAPWHVLDAASRRTLIDASNPVDGHHRLSHETQVLWMHVPFYGGGVRLLRFRNASWAPGRRTLFYLEFEGRTFRLNGISPPIHEINARAPIALSDSVVADYCRFFCFFVRGAEGPFQIVESIADRTLSPFMSDASRSVVAGVARPIEYQGLTAEGHYQLTATLVYSSAVFITTFRVQPNGIIELVNDEPIAADLGPLVDAPLS